MELTAVAAGATLQQLQAATFDCVVMDLGLSDMSGYELLDRMANEAAYSFPPVIIYTGRTLQRGDEERLRRYSHSIIIKSARSPERLLDEVTLFLHQVESQLPADQQRMLDAVRYRDSILEASDPCRRRRRAQHFCDQQRPCTEGRDDRDRPNGKEAIEVLQRNLQIQTVQHERRWLQRWRLD